MRVAVVVSQLYPCIVQHLLWERARVILDPRNWMHVVTCAVGWQGAFCKHQALVHHRHGGTFPNAPLLSAHDRHQLGLLALGDKCQPVAFFQGFQELPGQPSTSTAMEETGAPAEPSSDPRSAPAHPFGDGEGPSRARGDGLCRRHQGSVCSFCM